ncbi:uncharacterized protein [Miscanthus floridulus]|uniref:uncharacterized protein n=1 Tax=Miscanthus floridulus TaxID=154761 RepID=UPI003458EBE5
MARPSATAALLLLLVLSLLAVAHCRTVAIAADHAAEPESTAAVAVSDENGLSSNPTLPAEAGASATDEEALPVPAEQRHDFEFLRLPSHRLHRHRPCSLHHHLWWKRHHGVYRDAPRRFHDHYSGHGEKREAVSHLAILPAAAEEAREAEEVKPVAEPDPDRSLPDSDGEGEMVGREPSSFADADGHDGQRAASVRPWKKEMLRRWFHFHFHHGMRRHRLHHVHHDEEGQELEEEEEAAPEGMNRKRFHFVHHQHHDEEDEEKNMMRKRLRDAEHGEDSDEEDEQVEEMVRRFRKAIMKRRFGHGHGRRFFHHDHRHRHAEEAEKQAGGDEQSGVMAWIKGLMNRL